MKTIWQDVHFGIQLLSRNRGFTAVALLTLALCIGANSAIFTLVDAVVLRPLPYPDPDRLVLLYNSYPNVGATKGQNGVPDYLDRRRETDVFESLTLINRTSRNIGAEGSPRRISAARVTPTLFDTLGVHPALGRGFTEEEATIGKDQVAILSHQLWMEEFGGDPKAVGRSIRIEGTPFQVVGVTPSGFRLLERETALLLPFAFTERQMSDDARHSNFCDMIGRLRPGVDVAKAQQKIDLLNERNLERFPEYRELLKSAGFHTKVVGLHEELVEEARPILFLLQAGVAFVLLIGCLNVANLLLVRSNGRMKELAVRFALGAGRLRVARQLLTESLVLAVLGGALGLLAGWASLRGLVALFADRLPRLQQVELDGAAVLFTAAVALLTGLVFGAVPVAHVWRRSLESILRDGGRTGSSGVATSWTRSALAVAQISIACVLLTGAGLLALSFSRLTAVDPGFRPESVFSAQFNLPRGRYPEKADVESVSGRLLEEVRALPGVRSASLTDLLPFSGDNNASAISIENRPLKTGESPPVPHYAHVDTEYFETMRIPVLRGRPFDERDHADAQPVVVIDQALADRYWPDQDPIGRRLMRGIQEGNQNDETWRTIVGVVGDVRFASLALEDRVGAVYFPHRQFDNRSLSLVVRSDEPPDRLTSAVREAFLKIDPELPIYDAQAMVARLSDSLADRRAPMTLILCFASLALLLSAVGIYGVLAYSVSQRSREISIRMALGAAPGRILREVLWQGGKLLLLGLGLGLAGSAAASRLISSFLFEVHPADPGVISAVTAMICLVALAACLLPSLRATRVDAVVALRSE